MMLRNINGLLVFVFASKITHKCAKVVHLVSFYLITMKMDTSIN